MSSVCVFGHPESGMYIRDPIDSPEGREAIKNILKWVLRDREKYENSKTYGKERTENFIKQYQHLLDQ